MATTTARNKNDVDNMSARDRLYDSLNYSYGKKREESDKSFAKAYSQAVNQGIKAGMQRSSYGAQTLANIDKQKIDAQNDIYDAQIADYENRLYQLERDEVEDAWKQKQFDENQRQYNESLAFQKSEADRSQSNWEKEFAETLVQNKFNRDYMQDEFKYKYGLAGGGGSPSGGSSGGYSSTTSPKSTSTPAVTDQTFIQGLQPTQNGVAKTTAPSSGKKVPVSSNTNKTGVVKTNPVVYVDKDDTAANRKTQATWKRTTTK